MKAFVNEVAILLAYLGRSFIDHIVLVSFAFFTYEHICFLGYGDLFLGGHNCGFKSYGSSLLLLLLFLTYK